MNGEKARIYKRNIEGAPLHQFLGLKIESIGEGHSRVSVPVNDHTLNPAGSLHGGIIYIIADVAAFAALGPVLGEDEFAVTIDIHCSIYKATTSGPIIFKGRVTSRTRRLAFLNTEISDGDGKIIGEARVTKSIVNTVPESFRL